MNRSIYRFADLAATGSHAGASGGEKCCHRIANAIASIKDDLQMIDEEAVDGAAEFLKAIAGPHETEIERLTVDSIRRHATEEGE